MPATASAAICMRVSARSIALPQFFFVISFSKHWQAAPEGTAMDPHQRVGTHSSNSFTRTRGRPQHSPRNGKVGAHLRSFAVCTTLPPHVQCSRRPLQADTGDLSALEL